MLDYSREPTDTSSVKSIASEVTLTIEDDPACVVDSALGNCSFLQRQTGEKTHAMHVAFVTE